MKRIRNLTLFTLITLSLAIIGIGTYASYQQASALINPPRSRVSPRPDALLTAQEVEFTTDDNLTLRGWYLPPTETPGAAVLFVHGHGGNRSEFNDEATLLAEQGYGLLLFDLRNSGMSDGDQTTMGLYEVHDVQAAFAFLADQAETDPDHIVIYARSMGGATAIRAMPLLPQARGLIVETAYTSLNEVVGDGVTTLTHLPAFPWSQIVMAFAGNMTGADLQAGRPIDVVDQIAPRPILFLHGSDDNIILPQHSRRLYEVANEPKTLMIIEGGQHANLYDVAPDTVESAITEFLSTTLSQ